MNGVETQEIRGLLLGSNDQYRELNQQHRQLDHRLHELIEKAYLSTSEQLEKVTLKKRKLALKDRMEGIARDYAQAHRQAS